MVSKIILWVLLVCMSAVFCTKDQARNDMERDIEYVDPRYCNPHSEDPQFSHSVAFKIADTGQNTSFSSGDDGWYRVNSPKLPAMSFINNGNGTVSDSNTSLMWTKCSMGAGSAIDATVDCSGSMKNITGPTRYRPVKPSPMEGIPTGGFRHIPSCFLCLILESSALGRLQLMKIIFQIPNIPTCISGLI